MGASPSQWLAKGTIRLEENRARFCSYGGLAAAFLAFKYPRVFGKVLSQTGWYRWHPEGDPEYHWLARQIVQAAREPVAFWLQVGNLEIAQMLDGGLTQLAANQHRLQTLRAKCYRVDYREYSGGHDISSLEYSLSQALIDVLHED